MLRGIPVLFVSFAVLAAAGSGRAGEPDEDLALTERGAKILEPLEPTGETRSCIDITRIQSSRVLGDRAILFELKGHGLWLNILDSRCPSLAAQDQFTYSLSTSQLCSTDVVTVLMRGIGPGASCGLGPFLGYREKPAGE